MLKVNEYFEGTVMSIGFSNQDGPATVGVMEAGEFEFGTAKEEHITVVSGSMSIKLPGASDYKDFKAGDTFIIPANNKFQLRMTEQTAYLCLYK